MARSKAAKSEAVQRVAAEEQMRQVMEAGRKLCEADGNEEPKTVEIVWRLFREAADTYDRLPDREMDTLGQSHCLAGCRP